MLRFPKPDPTQTPEKNKFFKGLINALIICTPFWLAVVYLIWRW